jgi:hypothetical protein
MPRSKRAISVQKVPRRRKPEVVRKRPDEHTVSTELIGELVTAALRVAVAHKRRGYVAAVMELCSAALQFSVDTLIRDGLLVGVASADDSSSAN